MSFELISQTNPKASKEHTCIWCGETILKGERYIRTASKYYGDFQDHKMHVECDIAMEQWCCEVGEDNEFYPHDQKRGEWPE